MCLCVQVEHTGCSGTGWHRKTSQGRQFFTEVWWLYAARWVSMADLLYIEQTCATGSTSQVLHVISNRYSRVCVCEPWHSGFLLMLSSILKPFFQPPVIGSYQISCCLSPSIVQITLSSVNIWLPSTELDYCHETLLQPFNVLYPFRNCYCTF
jgi:hypothetical protein